MASTLYFTSRHEMFLIAPSYIVTILINNTSFMRGRKRKKERDKERKKGRKRGRKWKNRNIAKEQKENRKTLVLNILKNNNKLQNPHILTNCVQ